MYRTFNRIRPNSQLAQARSPIHRYDSPLCQFIDAEQRMKAFCNSSSPRPHCQAAALFRRSFYASDESLTRDQVWSVVCRWKAVKSLYLDGHTCAKSAYNLVRSMSLPGKEVSSARCCSGGRQDDLKACLTGMQSFAQYYQQVVWVWLTGEVEQCMAIF